MVDLNRYQIDVVLSLNVRHIHFLYNWKNNNEVIIGIGDKDNESMIIIFNYLKKSTMIIGKNYLYKYHTNTCELTKIREVEGPIYYSAKIPNNEMYFATTIENKKSHNAVVYKSIDRIHWSSIKRFKTNFLHKKYFGYAVINFMFGQEKLND
jgi:hypothetical protein